MLPLLISQIYFENPQRPINLSFTTGIFSRRVPALNTFQSEGV